MTDRELLELAAKAAGIPARVVGAEPGTYCLYPDRDGVEKFVSMRQWNPLADDGDALRLAVKLNIDIYTPDGDGRVGALDAECNETWESAGGDPLAAVRRVIVRAAAEIGRAT